MSDPAYFRRLFEYDDWANAAHLATLAAPEAVRAMGHLLAAREIWLLRVKMGQAPQVPEPFSPAKGGQAPGKPEPDPVSLKFFRHLDVDQCRELHEQVSADWRAWLNAATPADLDAQVTFQDSLGNPYTLTRRVMLTHVLLHSAHHRGQVAMAQRQAGLTPTDFDLYLSPIAQEMGPGSADA